MPPLPDLEAEIRERDGTLVAALPNAYNIGWEDLDNQIGNGRLSLPGDDPDGVEFTVGRDIWLYHRGTAAYHLSISKSPRRVLHSPEGEEAEERWEVAAEGILDEWMYANVLPFKGTTSALAIMPQHRLYTFASPDYPWATAAYGWGSPVGGLVANDPESPRRIQVEYRIVTTGDEDDVQQVYPPAPLEWVLPQAEWIWSQADTTIPGYAFFRTEFTLAEAKTVTFDVTADNYYTLFLDGQPLLGEDADPWCWQTFKRHVITDMPAGTYTIGAVVQNIESDAFNPAGFLFAAYVADADGGVAETVRWSSPFGWVSIGYPPDDEWPGWTPGLIIEDALAEFQSLGFLTGWTLDFTSTTDSNGDPWEPMSIFSVPIGQPAFSILQGLVDAGKIDFRALPTSRTLQAFVQSDGLDTGVAVSITGDVATQLLRSSEFDRVSEAPLSSVIGKWSNGFVESEDPGVAAVYGPRQAYTTLDAENETQAQTQLDQMLAVRNEPVWSNVIEITPISDANAPYTGYVPGQQITAPDVYSGTRTRRIKALLLQQNDEGVAQVLADLERRVELPGPDTDLLDTIGRGISGPDVLRNTGLPTPGRRGGGGQTTSRGGNASTTAPATRALYDPAPIRGDRIITVPETLGGGGGGPQHTIVELFQRNVSIESGSTIGPDLMFLTDQTVLDIQVSIGGASLSGLVDVDVAVSGGGNGSLFTTRPTIDVGELTSVTAATPAVLNGNLMLAGTLVTFDVVQSGSGAIGPMIVSILHEPAA